MALSSISDAIYTWTSSPSSFSANKPIKTFPFFYDLSTKETQRALLVLCILIRSAGLSKCCRIRQLKLIIKLTSNVKAATNGALPDTITDSRSNMNESSYSSNHQKFILKTQRNIIIILCPCYHDTIYKRP